MIFGLYLQSQKTNGVVVQLVRILPCHGRGRGFESRPHRKTKTLVTLGFFLFNIPHQATA